MSKQLREYVYKNPTAESCLGWDEIPASLKPTLDTLKNKKRNKKVQQLTTLLPNQSLKKGLISVEFLISYFIRNDGRDGDYTKFGLWESSKTVETTIKIRNFMFGVALVGILVCPPIWSSKEMTMISFLEWMIPIFLLVGLAGNLEYFPKKNREAFKAVGIFQNRMRDFFKCFPTLSKRFFKCWQVTEIQDLVENHLVRIATEILEFEIAHPIGFPTRTTNLRERFRRKHDIADVLGLVRSKKLYFMMAEEKIDRYQSFNPNI